MRWLFAGDGEEGGRELWRGFPVSELTTGAKVEIEGGGGGVSASVPVRVCH